MTAILMNAFGNIGAKMTDVSPTGNPDLDDEFAALSQIYAEDGAELVEWMGENNVLIPNMTASRKAELAGHLAGDIAAAVLHDRYMRAANETD